MGCRVTVYQCRSLPTVSQSCSSARVPTLIVGFPENRLLNSASLLGMRPIITRTERVAVNIADGFARATNGERLAPCVTQYGPGAEAAYGAVAQAYGDRSPILLLPGEHATSVLDSTVGVRSEEAYRPITRFAATLRDPAHGPGLFRQALNALYGVRNGPVLVAVANDVLNGDAGEADWNLPPLRRHLSQAAPDDVDEAARMLRAASNPVIVAGQGVLYADASRRAASGSPSAPRRRSRRRSTARAPSPRITRSRSEPRRARDRPRSTSTSSGRPDPRHRHELHALAVHHADAGAGDARPDHERPARPRDGLRHRVRLRRRRARLVLATAARRTGGGRRRTHRTPRSPRRSPPRTRRSSTSGVRA